MMTQEVSENVGAIDVCVSVTGPISYCPIEFDFNIDIHTTDGNAGNSLTTVVELYYFYSDGNVGYRGGSGL